MLPELGRRGWQAVTLVVAALAAAFLVFAVSALRPLLQRPPAPRYTLSCTQDHCYRLDVVSGDVKRID